MPHRSFAGNRPSELLLLDRLDARSLGMLLAFYEHKVFVESVLWGINAFDQWGVELGKTLAPGIQAALAAGSSGAAAPAWAAAGTHCPAAPRLRPSAIVSGCPPAALKFPRQV